MSDVIAQLPDEVVKAAFEGVSSSLLCQICFEPTDSWLVACGNHHSYCSTCLHDHVSAREREGDQATCPQCRGDLSRNAAGNFQPERTKNSMTLEKECECPLKCGDTFRIDKIKAHMQKDCQNAVVPCPMARFGCAHNMKRSEVAEHMATDSHANLAMAFFLKATEDFNTKVDELKGTIGNLRGTVQSQAATITNLNSALANHQSSLNAHGVKIDGLKTSHDTVERKLNEALSDGPYSLKQIADQTKKRARPGEGQSDRSRREKSQIQKLKDVVETLQGTGEAEAAGEAEGATADE